MFVIGDILHYGSQCAYCNYYEQVRERDYFASVRRVLQIICDKRPQQCNKRHIITHHNYIQSNSMIMFSKAGLYSIPCCICYFLKHNISIPYMPCIQVVASYVKYREKTLLHIWSYCLTFVNECSWQLLVANYVKYYENALSLLHIQSYYLTIVNEHSCFFHI